jgi:hypothetical protein
MLSFNTIQEYVGSDDNVAYGIVLSLCLDMAEGRRNFSIVFNMLF